MRPNASRPSKVVERNVQLLRVYQTQVCQTVPAPISAALNLHNNIVCLPHLEITVCIRAIELIIQTVFHAHWLCTCVDRGSEPCLAA